MKVSVDRIHRRLLEAWASGQVELGVKSWLAGGARKAFRDNAGRLAGWLGSDGNGPRVT